MFYVLFTMLPAAVVCCFRPSGNCLGKNEAHDTNTIHNRGGRTVGEGEPETFSASTSLKALVGYFVSHKSCWYQKTIKWSGQKHLRYFKKLYRGSVKKGH